MNSILLLLLVGSTAVVYGQRRELESDLKGIASTHMEVIADDPSEVTRMSISLSLNNIVDYDSKKQILDVNGWLAIRWDDKRYAWDASNYGNISKISLPCKDFVKPDVKLYNSAEDGMKVDDNVNCVIINTGEIYYIPQVSIHSYCPNVDPTDDTFTCTLKFGSWTHPCHDLNITRNVKKAIDLEHFNTGWRWQLVEHSASVHERLYSCCPHSYCTMEMKLKIRDRSRTPRGRWYYRQCI